jgi:hypothetical protein
VPRLLWPIGERLEPRFGRLGHEYAQVVFDKKLLADTPSVEWVTPGHPLFESVREHTLERAGEDLSRGAIFYDLNAPSSYVLDVFSAGIKDGRGNLLHRRLFVVQTDRAGAMSVRQPTIFLDLLPAPADAPRSQDFDPPDRARAEETLIEEALTPLLAEVRAGRLKDVETIERHMDISLNAIINRVQCQFAALEAQRNPDGPQEPGIEGRLKQFEERLEELNGRLERRHAELAQERQCVITDMQHHGRAWVLPHPERDAPGVAPMVRDDEIERIAVQAVIAHEEAQGRVVQSVELENRGFDLISRRPHPEDPATAIDVRFIEVKGRAGVGEVALSDNEYKTAGRLRRDYWLYVVFNCAGAPQVHPIQDPARLGWQPVVQIEHYRVGASAILEAG